MRSIQCFGSAYEPIKLQENLYPVLVVARTAQKMLTISLCIQGHKYYRNLKLDGQGNLQDQVTNSFEVPLSLGLSKAFIEEKRKIIIKKNTSSVVK